MFLLFCFKRVGFPIHPEIFYIFERCDRCRIRTRDLWPKVWCTNNEPPHIKCFKLFFLYDKHMHAGIYYGNYFEIS